MTIRSLEHNDTFFSSRPRTITGTLVPPFTLFISPSSTNHTSSKPFVFSSNKRKPTGIQSTTNAHIDEAPAVPRSSTHPLAFLPLLLLLQCYCSKGPGFASHFFLPSRSSIFEPRPCWSLPSRSDRCGNNYRRTVAQ